MKGALHAGQHARDAAEIDVADEAPALERSMCRFLHDALLEHGDARFLGRYVDEDLMRHLGAAPPVTPRNPAAYRCGRTPL
jgi:hypothetical protein